MKERNQFLQRSIRVQAAALIALSGSWSAGLAETQFPEQATLQVSENVTITAPAPEGAARPTPNVPTHGAYILGPGDVVAIELLDVPEYSGVYTIGPDGTLYLPRLHSNVVEGLTVEELRSFLTRQFLTYVRDPQVFVNVVTYRPIRVYIGGEVARPGYYYLSDQQSAVGNEAFSSATQSGSLDLSTGLVGFTDMGNTYPSTQKNPRIGGVDINLGLRLPTVFDALQRRWRYTFSNSVSFHTVNYLSAAVRKDTHNP